MKTALITGGGSGIGQALAWELAQRGLRVFIVGRRPEKLALTVQAFPENIAMISADISTPEGRAYTVSKLTDIQLDYLIHNAATAAPFALIGSLELQEWRQTLATNLEAPLFLTQALLPQLKLESRILNISSGLAHHALKGVSTYCTSKAGLYMVYLAFNAELNSRSIYAGSVMPGIVDTEMQAHMRTQDASNLPDVAMFKYFKTEGTLRSGSSVAKLLAQFLQQSSNECFTQKDWAIEELELIFAKEGCTRD